MKAYLLLIAIIATTVYSQKSTLVFTADNIVNGIKINGKDLNLAGVANLNNWTQLSTINLDYPLREGDTISFNISNSGTFTYGNPANLVASITYFTSSNEQKTLLTNLNDWTYNGNPVSSYGPLDFDTNYINARIPGALHIYSLRLYDQGVVIDGKIPFENEKYNNMNVLQTICTPGDYSVETIHENRTKSSFVCNLINKAGKTIKQEDIYSFLIKRQIIVKIQDSNHTVVKENYDINYTTVDTYFLFEVFLDNPVKQYQSVKYDVENQRIELIITKS